jgi:hypothetical protein
MNSRFRKACAPAWTKPLSSSMRFVPCDFDNTYWTR